jgi:hypothetical protein
MRETTRECGLTNDSITCAQQALAFLASARTKLHQLQSDGGVPYLFPECWICLAALGIATVLVQTLNAAAEASGTSNGGVTGPQGPRTSRVSILAGSSATDSQRLSQTERVFGTPDSLHDLLPPAVAVSVHQLLDTLKASQEREEAGTRRVATGTARVSTGVGLDETVRVAPTSPARLPEMDAAQMLAKMHLIVAQVLTSAYLVRFFR